MRAKTKAQKALNKKKLGNKVKPRKQIAFNLPTHNKNEFWKARSKHGRDTIFASGAVMLEAAEEYFQWCEDNPLYKTEWKDRGLEEIPLRRPYTMIGFALFCGVSSGYVKDFKLSAAAQKGDFLAVIKIIEETVYNQKYEGASVGHFNANLIARDLGLAEKSEVKTDQPIQSPVVNVYNAAPPLAATEEEIDKPAKAKTKK